MAGGQNDLSRQRQSRSHSFEHYLKFWDEEGEQEHQHRQGERQKHGRVKHGRHDLRAQVLFARLDIRNLRQDKVQESA